MCGIAAVVNSRTTRLDLNRMVAAQTHRGPDATGVYVAPAETAGLGHNRLTIIDRSDAGRQPMSTTAGRYWIVFNGEIYNYRELRSELHAYPYRSQTDTEVVLAAYERWGQDCLRRFIGMFAFAIWDESKQELFAARDRFGVKPLFFGQRADGAFLIGSEIKALHAAGIPAEPDDTAWATYLTHGVSDHSTRTFWRNVMSLPGGHSLLWQRNRLQITPWYGLAEEVGDAIDRRPVGEVIEEYTSLLQDSVRLRFRSDVPVGINLSGGLDSSTLLGVVDALDDETRAVKAFTFITGDPSYDELPWVSRMLADRAHPLEVCTLSAADVPDLALSVQASADEPFGGIPTLAYAKLFEQAHRQGVTVLLDGQGMDEQWAGYSYYLHAGSPGGAAIVQGTSQSAVRSDCLVPEFRDLAEPFEPAQPFSSPLRNLQYRDFVSTKIPRALRFNDRASMRSSIELREPFLDHRLVELALRQPDDRKISNGVSKWMLRQIAGHLMPRDLVLAPKRPVQTPQREWFRGPLRDWANARIEEALAWRGDWLDRTVSRESWNAYCSGSADNSFYVWQWINLGLVHAVQGVACESA